MRRKSFDAIVSVGGLLLTVVLVAAGALLLWGYSFANTNVPNQLADQKIAFPSATAFAHAKPGTEITPGMIPYLGKYAGQQLTGPGRSVRGPLHRHSPTRDRGRQDVRELSAKALALPEVSAATPPPRPRSRRSSRAPRSGACSSTPTAGAFGQIALIGAIVARTGRGHPAAVGLRVLALPPGARGGRRSPSSPGPRPIDHKLAPSPS